MADLALASPPIAAASPIAALLATTPAKGVVQPGAADPFSVLMAAAAPAAPAPLVTFRLVEEPKAAAVAEKTGDGETAKDDGDKAADPDALLALLTTPASVVAPASIVQPIVTAPLIVPVSDTPAAPVTKTRVAIAQPVASAPLPTSVGDMPAAPALKAITAIALPAVLVQPSASSVDPAPAAPTTQTSTVALAQMMTAQADPDTVPQPIATQIAAQTMPQPMAIPPVATRTVAAAVGDEAASASIAQANSAIADGQAKPIARATRFLVPKLDAARDANAKAQSEALPAKAEATPGKSPHRDDRDTGTRLPTDTAPQAQPQDIKPAPREIAAVSVKAADLGSTDAVVTRHLAIAQDGQWLDSLTKDIVATGGNSGSLSFTLSPENLGALKVDITQGSDGASVHMTTDNDTARNIILDAQPRLAAEARAQGLMLKETSVSTNSDQQRQAPSQQQAQNSAFAQSNNPQPGQDRRAFAQAAQPIAPPLSSPADKESDGELYA